MAGKKRGWKGNEAGGCFMVLNWVTKVLEGLPKFLGVWFEGLS